MRTMPAAVLGLERFNGELLELEALLIDLLLALELRPKRQRPARTRQPRPPRLPRHPSGGFPGHLFGGKGLG